MKKRLLSVLLAVIMLLSLIPITATAADFSNYCLFGFIDGSDYGQEMDWEYVGQYVFNSEGILNTSFNEDSYVAVKTTNCMNWFMFESYVTSGNPGSVLKSTELGTSEKMFVPGGVPVTFKLEDTSDGNLMLSYTTQSAEGTESNPWNVGTTGHESEVKAYIKDGELYVTGAGTVGNLNVVTNKEAISAITVKDATITGAESNSFVGFESVILTLPDGWVGELPDEDGNWYGALYTNLNAFPKTVKNVTFQQRYPWNGIVDISAEVFGDDSHSVSVAIFNKVAGEWQQIATPAVMGDTMVDLGFGESATIQFVWNASADLENENLNEVYAEVIMDETVSAKSDVNYVDNRPNVMLPEGETVIKGVTWSDTIWNGSSPSGITIGWENMDTHETGVLAENLMSDGMADVYLPNKNGVYKLTHSGGLYSFVTFTVSGFSPSIKFEVVGNGKVEYSKDYWSPSWEECGSEPIKVFENAGYYASGSADLYLSNDDSTEYWVFHAVPAEGYRFIGWSPDATIEKHMIDGCETITVTFAENVHNHNLVRVEGQAPTKTDAGWRDYYECKDIDDACHECFEDATGLVPIVNIDDWKAQGGPGYLPPRGYTLYLGAEPAESGFWTFVGQTDHITSVNEIPVDSIIYFYNDSSIDSNISICSSDWATTYCELQFHPNEDVTFKGWNVGNMSPITDDMTLNALFEKAPKTVMLNGYVYDDTRSTADEYVPVPGADVSFDVDGDHYSARSDGSGFFSMEVPMGVEGKLTVMAEGYEEYSRMAAYTEPSSFEFCWLKAFVPPHSHNLVMVAGQAPSETASGWRDYYECKDVDDACHEYFEDATGLVPIENIDDWKAQGGPGYVAPLVHTITPVEGKNPSDTEAGYKPYYECKNCGKYYEDADGLVEINNVDEWKAEDGNGYLAPLHGIDNDHNHICDYCDRQVSECKDENNDHNCDICGGQVSECKDENNDHNCDICGGQVSECKDENNDHNCDICGKQVSECKDENNDHNCDICGGQVSECKDDDHDHKCDICNGQVSECADTDKDHICDYCGNQVSEHKGVLVEGTAATLQSAGSKSYYMCDCGKFFEDATCKVEINDIEKWKAEGGAGYLPKLENSSTGDTSDMTLWIVLIALSSMGLCTCIVLGKKRKKAQ